MVRRTPSGPAASERPDPAAQSNATDDASVGARPDGIPALDGLPIAGITRRRVAFLLAAIVSVWIVIVFVRQVGDAAAANSRADQMAADNQARAAQVAALQRELAVVTRPEYIAQQARGAGLGSPNERRFSLAPGAPPLPADAPGSAAARLGEQSRTETPLDAWLSLLFGPTPASQP
jgi:cell division protein FtsB